MLLKDIAETIDKIWIALEIRRQQCDNATSVWQLCHVILTLIGNTWSSIQRSLDQQLITNDSRKKKMASLSPGFASQHRINQTSDGGTHLESWHLGGHRETQKFNVIPAYLVSSRKACMPWDLVSKKKKKTKNNNRLTRWPGK